MRIEVFFLKKKTHTDGPLFQVDRFLQAMRLGDEQLKDISSLFLAEMKKGLSAESNAAAVVKMLPTHVRSTPDGSGSKRHLFFSCFWMFSQQTLWTRSLSTLAAEKGQFLALDLGGSRFKVLCVKVREGKGVRRGRVEMQEKIFPIPQELLEGKGAEVRRWHENGGGEAERQ